MSRRSWDMDNQPSFFLRFSILVGLTLQTSSYVVLRRYASVVAHASFDKSSVLLVAELLKLLISSFAIVCKFGSSTPRYEMTGLTQTSDETASLEEEPKNRLWVLCVTSGPMAVQAMVYLIQNLLAFVALEHLDGGTYSLLMQGKVFATALFSMVLMSNTISGRQWRSLLMLVLAVVQITSQTKPENTKSELGQRYMHGLFLTFINVMLSGFSTVYMERTFKDTSRDLTMWERNFQLSICSIIVYIGIVAFNKGLIDIFEGWSFLAFTISFVSGVGGILVAASLKFTDSILKSFASTMAIVLTTIVEWQFMGGPMNLLVAIGASFVILSVYNYNDN
eukprot:c9247_g1_i1.p1 GENE.c9247_g1_i1~~c9247_g1_i1.p1  ORF type:complete len:336 (+),score=42.18 c9247_g1_i1:25-1032(+)